MKSIAVEREDGEGYYGIYFKEWNTGWSAGPIKIGKGYISNGSFDFTENFQEAIDHASIKEPNGE